MTATRETFGARLRQELDRAGVSQRELAARLAGSRDPGAIDAHRSSIRKHLNGQHAPRRATRIAYALALGLDRDHFEDEDEEEDPLEALVDELVARIFLEAYRALERQLAGVEKAA